MHKMNPGFRSRDSGSFTSLALIGGGSLTLVLLSLTLYRAGWKGQMPSSREVWATLFLALTSTAVLIFASHRLRSALKTSVVVVGLSLIALLYTAELTLRSGLIAASTPAWSIDRASNKKGIATLAEGFGVAIDARDRVDVIADLRRQHLQPVPAIMLGNILTGDGPKQWSESSPGDEKLLPLGGISSASTILCNESGSYVAYESDEHGFRNPRGVWSAPRADLAAVGESFVQGYCAPSGTSFVDLLRPQHPVTLNLGVSGESSLLQLAAIREYLPQYAPKTVLWFFCEGIDLVDLYEESTHPSLMSYLDPTFKQDLLKRQPEIDASLRRFAATLEARERESQAHVGGGSMTERTLGILKLWSLREKLDLVYGINREHAQLWSMLQQRSRNVLADTLSEARTATNGWGGTLYFVYLPSWSRYRNGPRVPDRERTDVLRLVNDLGIPVIDVQPAFAGHVDPLALFPFRRFGHYNEAGNRVVADTVLRALSERRSEHVVRLDRSKTGPPSSGR